MWNQGAARVVFTDQSPEGAIESSPGQRPGSLCALALTQELAWSCAGAFAVFEGRLTIDDNSVIALSALDAPPFSTGEVVRHFTNPVWLDPQAV